MIWVTKWQSLTTAIELKPTNLGSRKRELETTMSADIVHIGQIDQEMKKELEIQKEPEQSQEVHDVETGSEPDTTAINRVYR